MTKCSLSISGTRISNQIKSQLNCLKAPRLPVAMKVLILYMYLKIFRYGIQKSINHVLQKLDPEGKKPIHVSFDIDSIDAMVAPSTGTPGIYQNININIKKNYIFKSKISLYLYD